MPAKRIFVGRQGELAQFAQVLADPQGQAVLVVGQAGMGKSWVIQEMVARAENGTLFQGEPGPKCWAVSYEIRPTDSVNRVVEQIVADACEAAHPMRQKLGLTRDKKDKWRALFGTAGLVPVFGPSLRQLGELFLTFVKTPPRDTRDAFVGAMQKMSDCLSDEQRALFIVDPDKTMPADSDDLWRSVVQELPDKIKLVFAQRPYDVLVNNLEFCSLPNVVRLPRQTEQLDALRDKAVEELTDRYARMTGQSGKTLRDAVRPYNGHAYSTVAALELLRRGTKPEALPKDPGGIAAAQWKEICKTGSGAIRLFKTYAILQVPVPVEVVTAVAELDADTYQSLVAHDYLGGLLGREDEDRAIYHAILADHVLYQMDENETRNYHRRAAETYRARLHAEAKPDSLSAEQLPAHVLEAEGEPAFVRTLTDVCTPPLFSLGRLDTLVRLSEMALQLTTQGTADHSVITGNLGTVYQTRGDLDKAEQMHRQALEIDEKLGRLRGMARGYGNLGAVYRIRGDLAQAERMYRRALEISEKLGRLDDVATLCGKLGVVYKTRGNLYQAAQMHWYALEIDTKLGQLEGMATQYGNLGLVYQLRGDLDHAEQMLRQALKIDEKLGRLESMAGEYGNLGNICRDRGDLKQAAQMYRKALATYKQFGHLEGMAIAYGNLGTIYTSRGELDRAERMHRKALETNKKMGRLEGIAANYGNLGGLCEARRDFDKAREYWTKAIELYRKVGMPHMVEQGQGWLARLESKE